MKTIPILAALALASPVAARAPGVDARTVIDRVQIEDMMIEYYSVLTQHERHAIGDYFTEDAVIDVNGFKLDGRAAIQHFYDNGVDTRIPNASTYDMLLSNTRIVVTGDSAVMDAIWTGYLADNQYTAPRLVEQGTEHSTFVKRGGTWMIASRKLVNTAGMPTVIGEKAGN